MPKARRISGPPAAAMRELVARISFSLRSLLRAETRADANVHIRELDKSLQMWATMWLPKPAEFRGFGQVVSNGESTTDQPAPVAPTPVAEAVGSTDKVD